MKTEEVVQYWEVNRFEVINHLTDGEGREVVVWKDKTFKVNVKIQDNGWTLKVFLTEERQGDG